MTEGVEIVMGTYEEFLVGYKVKRVPGEKSFELSASFATHAHSGSVKCAIASGRYLYSGGADDKIVVHDMNSRTESRVLVHHDGTVNALALTDDNTHLFTAGSDGSLYAVRIGNWKIEKHWPKAHKGSPVTYISIHPSNKLALTIGDDHTLRTWNLIKGRQAYAINLKSKGAASPIGVYWSPDGSQFSLTGYNKVSIWSVDNASVKKVLECPSKSICMAWASDTVVLVGLESGEVSMFNLDTDTVQTFKCHEQRVKGIAKFHNYLYTASSAGDLSLWRVNMEKMKLTKKASVNTDCRITCLTLVNPCELIKTEKLEDDAEIVNESDVERIEEVDDKMETSNPNVAEISKMVKTSLNPYVSVEYDEATKVNKKKKRFDFKKSGDKKKFDFKKSGDKKKFDFKKSRDKKTFDFKKSGEKKTFDFKKKGDNKKLNFKKNKLAKKGKNKAKKT